MEQMRRARSQEEVKEVKRALEEQGRSRKEELGAAEGIKWMGLVGWGDGEGRGECEN